MKIITNSDRLIKTDDLTYPVYLHQVRKEVKHISLPEKPTDDQLLMLGYELVEPTERPTGDVITEGVPEQDQGVWKQTWSVRGYNEVEIANQLEREKTKLLNDVNEYQNALFKYGIEYAFNEGNYHIQVRDGDRANLAGMRLLANAQIDGGTTEAAIFRTRENVFVSMTPQEVVDMTNFALVGFYGVLGNIWNLKDQISEAVDLTELPVVPPMPSV